MELDHRRATAALFDGVAAGFDQHVSFFSAFADQFMAWVPLSGSAVLLDLGTGRGALADRAPAGTEVVRVDVSWEMLVRNRGLRCLMDGVALGLRASGFDTVVSAFTHHLLPDPLAGMGEVLRVLRPGGLLALCGAAPPPESMRPYHDLLDRYRARLPKDSWRPGMVPIPEPPELLGELGLVDIATRIVTVSLAVDSPDTFIAGELSHGTRSLFDALAPEDRRQLEDELRAWLEECQASGGIRLERSATFAMGRKV